MTARVGDELESLCNYVNLQKYRYGDIFEFRTEIADGVEDCMICRFILQPLVENTLIHGFDDKESGGEILLRCLKEGGLLRIDLIDNGSGMDEAALAALNGEGGSDAPDKRSSSIGVANIRERVRLQYGGRASIIFSGSPGTGTTVTLRFPLT
jgi:two-component system sensor histidine kinase YesM